MHGGDIYAGDYRIDFSANINPLGTPPSVVRAACEGVQKSGNYPDTRCRELRKALGEAYQVPAEWIVCGNGAADLIYGLVLAQKPRKALLVAPGFSEYEQALRTVGCTLDFYLCRREQGFVLQEDYLQRITPELDMMFLCNPSNPTGLLIPQKLLERSLDRAHQCGVVVVLDECFNGLLQQAEQVTMKHRLQEIPELFLLGAFTKLYAMAGLRLGYGICSDQERIKRLRGVSQPWNVSLPAQMAGVAALGERDYVVQSRAYLAQEREFLKQNFRELGLKYYDSQANYLFFEGPEDLYRRCAGEGILIRDCSDYRGLGKGYYRAAVRTREENEELIRVLGKVI